MHWIETVASYLPSLIISHLINRTTNEELPSRQEYDTVCLFADVSGFTALSEAMMSSADGVEGLAKHLNSYFEMMVKIIASEGGDVFKFVGDAVIVLWPPPAREALTDIGKKGQEGESGEREATTPMERRVRRAAQCAFAIQDVLHNAELTQEVRLSVKIGIGMGKMSVLHLGGVYKRMEYIAVGEPLLEAFTAEHHATPGDVIISAQAHKLVKDHFHNKFLFPDLYCRIGKELNYNPMRKVNKVNMLQQSLDDPLLEMKIKGYIPGAVLRNLRPDSPEDEHWSNEIRRVTVLFVNLGLKEQTLLAAAVYDEAMKETHQVMVAVQESVYEYEGSINKFLMDDKGSTLVAVYGLPPVGHADDPTRGVLAALRLCERLFDLAKVGSVGITTGEAFCGVVGSKTRKEYTVLGDSVNLAARLMQKAISEDGGVMCELATKRACGGLLQFKARGDHRLKGKTVAAKVFQPYPEDFPKPKPPQYLGANVYGLIHQQQRQNYAMHKLLTSLQAYFARPAVKEISGVSSPISEQRLRFSGTYTERTSMVSARNHVDEGRVDGRETEEHVGEEEVVEEDFADTLLGMAEQESEDSDSANLEIHAELQEPSYSSQSAHFPFRTGPLPMLLRMDMDGEVPFESLRQEPYRPVTNSGREIGEAGVSRGAPGQESKDANGDGDGDGGGDDDQLDLSNHGARRSLARFDELGNGRGPLADGHGDRRLQDGGGGGSGPSAAAGIDGDDPERGPAADGAEAVGRPQRSSSLTAKIFAFAHVDRGGSDGRSSSESGDGCGDDEKASPSSLSPDALPPRDMSGRRQGDSRLQKLFRSADDEDSRGSASQPTSPTAAAARSLRKHGRGGRLRSLASSISAPAVVIAPPRAAVDDSAAAAVAAAAKGVGVGVPTEVVVATSTARDGSGGDGDGARSSSAAALARSREGEGVDNSGNGSSRGPSLSLGRSGGVKKGLGGIAGSMKQALQVAPSGDGVEGKSMEEEKLGMTGERETNILDGNMSDSKGAFAPALSKSRRASFVHTQSGGVADHELELMAARGHRRRKTSQRLSISQNGMVPLPASAGIPQSDLGESGSCSLPRYSRLSRHPFSTGSGGGTRGVHYPGHLHVGTAQSYPGAGGGPAAAPTPPLVGGSSLPTPHIPSAMKNGRRMDDSVSSSASGGGGGARSHQPANGDRDSGFDETRLQVVVPRSWKWTSLPDYCHRLPIIHTSDVGTFQALVDRCWEAACAEAEVKGWPQPPPAREDMVLNILGTRAMLPTEPDYDIGLLPHFVKEACGTRRFRGKFMDRKRTFPPDYGSTGGGTLDLCLLPRSEILNVQSRWLTSRISLLQHKLALIGGEKIGSVLLLEGLPGSGKTETLSVFAARTIPRTALIHFTAASPYHSNKSFGGWSMVLQQYLDSLLKQEALKEDSSAHSGGRRPSVPPPGAGSEQANGASILGQRPLGHRDRMLLRELEDFPDMRAFAFLVNDVLGTNIPITARTWDAYSSDSSSSGVSDGANGNESDGSDVDDGLSVVHQQRLKLSILLQLVKNMASSKHRVVVIDDAQFLDKDSWTLALQVATGGPLGSPLPLMLILAFRPLLHYRPIFASIAPDYKALTELEHVKFLKIPGAPLEEVEDLVSEKLGTNVVEIGDTLLGLMEELCGGNPLMITELVSHLKMMEPKQLRYFPIRSEEGDLGDSHNNIQVDVQVDLTADFCLSGSLLPDKLNALLTSQTDRLNSCQLMALKVASLIGKQFSTWFLYEVYPIKGHKNRLLRELAELEEQGFLVEVQGFQAAAVIETEGWARPSIAAAVGGVSLDSRTSADGASAPVKRDSSRHLWGIPNVVYVFTHGFMMEMLQLKMLRSQTKMLKGGIKKLRDRLETERRHQQYKNLPIDRSKKQKAGVLSVMKYKVTMSQAATNARETTRRRKNSVTSRAIRSVRRPVHQKWTEALDWKKRRCLLTGESLSLFSDPRDTEPSQIVYLEGANAEPELGEAFKDLAFRVEACKWKKGDEVLDGTERRTFTFLAESTGDRDTWLYQIKHCIEVIKVLNGEAGPAKADRLMRSNSSRSARFGAGSADVGEGADAEEVDSTLIVRVEQADDLVLEETYGKVYPYCLVDLDDQNRRTSSVQSDSTKPSWQEELTFEVSIQQWVLSKLRIQVWHKDLFLTDDFLGNVTIPLKEVAVQEWGDADTPVPELKWYNLESRGRTKRASGRLLLGVRLVMNRSTSERAQAVGGVNNLKDIAGQRMSVSSQAALAGHFNLRKQCLPGLLHKVTQPSDAHNGALHPHPHPHHHHHGQQHQYHHGHPGAGGAGGGIMTMMPSRQPAPSRRTPDTYIRASVRSMEMELLETRAADAAANADGRFARYQSEGGRSSSTSLRSAAFDAASSFLAAARSQSFLQPPPPPQEMGDGSRHSADVAEDRSAASGHEGDGMTAAAPRMSSRSRRRSTGARKSSRRAVSESSSGAGVGFNATEALHTDPLTRQLMLMLLAVETKAKISMPEEGEGAVNREWIRLKLKELLRMAGRSDVDLDQLDTHTYYCKDRKENQYGPFPAKQLVEAHNAGYINDRKVLVKEARMKGEFRPMGARSLMHGPSSDEAFKSLTAWPQVDAHHPLADRILSPGPPGDGHGSSRDFRRWSFNIFGLERQDLGMLAATVLAETGLPRVFRISMKTFAHFMSAVGFFMGRNPRVSYHNLYHAVDVMQATYLTLFSTGASGLLNQTEQLALILSALCHDLDHPGLTNAFQTATGSPLATMYNDQSPLEHHHLAILFQILRREGCDILENVEKPQRTRIRQMMIDGILATEMSEHGAHIAKVEKLIAEFPAIAQRTTEWAVSGQQLFGRQTTPFASSLSALSLAPPAASPRPFPVMEPRAASTSSLSGLAGSRLGGSGLRGLQMPGDEATAIGLSDGDRLTVASALLHAMDVSSPGRPFATCKVWVLRLLDEFKFQAEQERQRGLRVTVLEGMPSASQPGFIDAVLLPFFTVLLPVAPGLADEYIPNLRDNRNRWQAIAEQDAQRASPANINNPMPPARNNSVSSTGNGNKASDRSSSGRNITADSGNGGGGWGLHHLRQAPLSSIGTGGQRRHSVGTIRSNGRSISDGNMNRRFSSVLSTQEVPAEIGGLGNSNGSGAPWSMQQSAAAGVPRAPSSPRKGVEGPAMAVGWSIEDSIEERHAELKSEDAAEVAPVEAWPGAEGSPDAAPSVQVPPAHMSLAHVSSEHLRVDSPEALPE